MVNNLLTIFFHQSQQIKNNGNKNILPQIIVFQKQHKLLFLINVPEIFNRNDLNLDNYYALIYFDFKDIEYELPLNV